MSWVAHDAEPYVIQKHLGKRIAFVPLLIGSYAPDMATKWFVYGAGLFGVELKADNPAQFHRGYPGVGFTQEGILRSRRFNPRQGRRVDFVMYSLLRDELEAR